MVVLPPDKYYLLYILEKVNLFPIIASVVYLKQDGKIFVDNINNPKIVFIIHKSSFSYLYTSKEIIDYTGLFDFFSSDNYIPQYFHIYDASANLISSIQEYGKFNSKIRKRMRMQGPPCFDKFNDIDMNDYNVKSIDDIDSKELSVFNLSFIEKYWNSIDDFIKNGFGWVILMDNKPVSIWYTLCVLNNNCETDILTLPEYRGKGLASITGYYILKTCIERNVNMDWDVFTDNIPSIKIGEKFCYKPYFYYNFLSIFNKDK